MAAASLSLGRIPGLRLDRAGIALTGAALMMAVGAIAPERCMSLSTHTAPIRQTRRSLQSANARTTCTEISAQNERYPLVCLYIAAVAGQLAAAA